MDQEPTSNSVIILFVVGMVVLVIFGLLVWSIVELRNAPYGLSL